MRGSGVSDTKTDVMSAAMASQHGANVHFPPPLVFVGFTLLGVTLRYTVGPIPFPGMSWTRLVGIVILLAGITIIISARTLFARTGQSPAPWKPTPELLLRGPYRFTRNPMYVGATCVQIGLGVAIGNPWIALLAPVALLTVHFIAVVPEEKYLAEKFGPSYHEYRARVRRYL
jgi:protein-S-isoprenylcysteine O-methyltransferase Ste14